MDENGYVHIVGRLKEMVIRGGENIFPREIEEFLIRHPKVADVHVLGVPDAYFGEALLAVVRPKANVQPSDEELKAFCAGQISHQKIPRYGGKWEQLSHSMVDLVPYENTARLLYDMECYDVDMCVLLPAFGMTDEINMQIVEQHPDKFVAECDAQAYSQRARNGEIEWSIEGVCKELDHLLSSGKFVGIGEISPYMPMPPDPYNPVSRETAVTNMLAILEVARRHKVSARVHSGCTMGYDVPYSSGGLGPFNYNPLWVHDLASVFPDVPLIIDHGGVQGWWSEKLQEDCLPVAASHSNVYLETGLWWTELYERALADPYIGADKLLWGTDWGASIPFHSQPGRYPPSYAVQLRKKGPVNHQVDFWGWSMREMARLRIPQDDLNLILGGNAVRLYNLPVKHTRLFRPPEND